MNEEAINDDETVEFTLEDAYEHLKDVMVEMTQEMENLTHRCSNNETTTIPKGIQREEIAARHHKLVRALAKSFMREEPKDLPIPNTIDLYETLIRDIENIVDEIQRVTDDVQAKMTVTKKNIAYLESNKEGLEKMKVICSGAIESVGNETTAEEIAISKRLFQETKADLFSVVDQIFPNNDGFKDVLAALTHASSLGGDEVYINVESESLEFAKFLVEADLATYHRNDKNMIRMAELL